MRRALRHLQLVLGSLVALARAMEVPYQTLRHAMVERRNPSASLAFRAALAAGVPMESIVKGLWPVRLTVCPMCGRKVGIGRTELAPVR